MVALSIFTIAQATWFDLNVLKRSPGLLDDLSRADDSNNSTTAADESKPAASVSNAPTPEPTTSAPAETTEKPADPTTSEQTKGPDPTTSKGNDNTTPTAAPTTPTGGGGDGQTTPTPSPVGPSSGGGNGGNSGGNTSPTTRVTSVKTTSDGKTFEVPQTLTETPKPTTSAKPFTTIFTYTTTLSDGRTSAVETQSVVTPTLSEGQTNSGDNGMAPQTKNTIIGVCVGVGGAIVLAAVGVLVWRLRARRRDQDDGEDLVNYGAGTSQFNAGPEKNEPGSMSGRSPFQSTLESYHAPSSNTGTNF